jgi:hypothetical protein
MQESLAMCGMIEHSHYSKCVLRSIGKSEDKLSRGRVKVLRGPIFAALYKQLRNSSFIHTYVFISKSDSYSDATDCYCYTCHACGDLNRMDIRQDLTLRCDEAVVSSG